ARVWSAWHPTAPRLCARRAYGSRQTSRVRPRVCRRPLRLLAYACGPDAYASTLRCAPTWREPAHWQLHARDCQRRLYGGGHGLVADLPPPGRAPAADRAPAEAGD